MDSHLRHLAIHNQGLINTSAFDEGINGTQQAIEHLGYVQIDTISVVERSHHHTLWNRVPTYEKHHLNQLIQDRKIFEYWYHAASYLPMRDYRYALPSMQLVRNGGSRYFSRGEPKLMREIIRRIEVEGALKLRNLDQKTKTDNEGWWNFGPARRSIEQLFMQGDLMIVQRNGMEKVFDLAERCLANDIDLSTPTLQEYAHYLFTTTLRAHGVFTWKQLIHLRLGKEIRDAMRNVILEHIDAGLITQQNNLQGHVYYVDTLQLEQLKKGSKQSFGLKILSPFDNLIIHRERLKSLFNFDYKIECYVPASKRIYGYFSLPILYGDQLVAGMDCKAHRQEQKLKVLSFHLEKNIKIDKEHFMKCLNQEFQSFAIFNQCKLAESHSFEF